MNNKDLEFDFKAYLRKKEEEKLAKEQPQVVEKKVEVCPKCGELVDDCICDECDEEEYEPRFNRKYRVNEDKRHPIEEDDDDLNYEYEMRKRHLQERRMFRQRERMDEKFLEEDDDKVQQVQQPQVVVLQQPQVEEPESENDKIMKEIEKSKNELKKYIDVIFCQYGSTGLKRLETLMKKDLEAYFSTGVAPEEKVEPKVEEPIAPKVEEPKVEEVEEENVVVEPVKKKVVPFKVAKPQVEEVEEEETEEEYVEGEDDQEAALMSALCDTESSVNSVNTINQVQQQKKQQQQGQQPQYNQPQYNQPQYAQPSYDNNVESEGDEIDANIMSDLIGFESNYHPNATPNNAPVNSMQNNPMAQTYNPTQANNAPVGYAPQPQEAPQVEQPQVEQPQVEQPAPQKVAKVKRTKKKVQ